MWRRVLRATFLHPAKISYRKIGKARLAMVKVSGAPPLNTEKKDHGPNAADVPDKDVLEIATAPPPPSQVESADKSSFPTQANFAAIGHEVGPSLNTHERRTLMFKLIQQFQKETDIKLSKSLEENYIKVRNVMEQKRRKKPHIAKRSLGRALQLRALVDRQKNQRWVMKILGKMSDLHYAPTFTDKLCYNLAKIIYGRGTVEDRKSRVLILLRRYGITFGPQGVPIIDLVDPKRALVIADWLRRRDQWLRRYQQAIKSETVRSKGRMVAVKLATDSDVRRLTFLKGGINQQVAKDLIAQLDALRSNYIMILSARGAFKDARHVSHKRKMLLLSGDVEEEPGPMEDLVEEQDVEILMLAQHVLGASVKKDSQGQALVGDLRELSTRLAGYDLRHAPKLAVRSLYASLRYFGVSGPHDLNCPNYARTTTMSALLLEIHENRINMSDVSYAEKDIIGAQAAPVPEVKRRRPLPAEAIARRVDMLNNECPQIILDADGEVIVNSLVPRDFLEDIREHGLKSYHAKNAPTFGAESIAQKPTDSRSYLDLVWVFNPLIPFIFVMVFINLSIDVVSVKLVHGVWGYASVVRSIGRAASLLVLIKHVENVMTGIYWVIGLRGSNRAHVTLARWACALPLLAPIISATWWEAWKIIMWFTLPVAADAVCWLRIWQSLMDGSAYARGGSPRGDALALIFTIIVLCITCSGLPVDAPMRLRGAATIVVQIILYAIAKLVNPKMIKLLAGLQTKLDEQRTCIVTLQDDYTTRKFFTIIQRGVVVRRYVFKPIAATTLYQQMNKASACETPGLFGAFEVWDEIFTGFGDYISKKTCESLFDLERARGSFRGFTSTLEESVCENGCLYETNQKYFRHPDDMSCAQDAHAYFRARLHGIIAKGAMGNVCHAWLLPGPCVDT